MFGRAFVLRRGNDPTVSGVAASARSRARRRMAAGSVMPSPAALSAGGASAGDTAKWTPQPPPTAASSLRPSCRQRAGSEAPRPTWHRALAQMHYALAAGHDVSDDHTQRICSLYASGAGSRSSAIRWWWLMRGECRPLTVAEAETLVSRDLWKQALYTTQTTLRPAEWPAEQYLRITLRTADMALGHGQWHEALRVLSSGYAAASRCLPPASGRAADDDDASASPESLPITSRANLHDDADAELESSEMSAVSVPQSSMPLATNCVSGSTLAHAHRMWRDEFAVLERRVVGRAVNAPADWAACLRAARALSPKTQPQTKRVLEHIALHRLAREPQQWARALRYIDATFALHTPNESAPPPDGGERRGAAPRIDASVAALAARIACDRMAEPRRVAFYVDALRRRRQSLSRTTQRTLLTRLEAQGASGRALSRLRGLFDDARKLETKRKAASTSSLSSLRPDTTRVRGVTATAAVEAVEDSETPIPHMTSSTREAAPADEGNAMPVLDAATLSLPVLELDDLAASRVEAGDIHGAVPYIASLFEIARDDGERSSSKRGLAERAVLDTLRDAGSWRDAVTIYVAQS